MLQAMRVVSMVPSWTETLLTAGIEVVGRTHFCIHPAEKVKTIPAVGGTKNLSEVKLKALNPDLLLLDKEENPREMSEAGVAYFATHIEKTADVAPALRELAELFKNKELAALATRWDKVLKPRPRLWENLPVTEWLKPPTASIQKIYYVIWREPWMVISQETFIGSMLGVLGFAEEVPLFPRKYPEILWNELNQADNCLLFSSEPYPFHIKRATIPELSPAALKCSAALVDGEPLSWYGVRSLRFLESGIKPR